MKYICCQTWRRRTESESDVGQTVATSGDRSRCKSESNVCNDESSGSTNDGQTPEHRDVNTGASDDKLVKAEMQKQLDQGVDDAVATRGVGVMPSEESFSDFVQYDVNEHPSDILKLPRKQVPRTLMQACVEAFQALFHTIVGVHIVKDTLLPDVVLEQLCGAGSPPSSNSTAQIALGDFSDDVCEVFECACQLLVSFSSFPMYCVDQARVSRRSSSHGKMNMFTNSLCLRENLNFSTISLCRAGHYLSHPVFSILCRECRCRTMWLRSHLKQWRNHFSLLFSNRLISIRHTFY